MNKFKAGDRVRVINETYDWKKGETFVIERIGEGFQKHVAFVGNKDYGVKFCDLELAPFTQEDLEVGMWIEEDDCMYKVINPNAVYVNDFDAIVRIYKPNENGDLIKVWEREEKRYTLQCPITKTICVIFDANKEFSWFNLIDVQYKFTQKEIDNMPNQDYVSQLIKVEVE